MIHHQKYISERGSNTASYSLLLLLIACAVLISTGSSQSLPQGVKHVFVSAQNDLSDGGSTIGTSGTKHETEPANCTSGAEGSHCAFVPPGSE
ncbi:MAG: hypothetical protein J0M12_05825 [Deltaproteobacteria bacterium]|nr:hypothetical protein [Deltaproteobacteria bacterium]